MDQARAKLALEYVTEHFAVVSAVVVMAAFLSAITCLFAYLSRFDWRLIWVVDYGDVFKAGMVALAVMSSFAVAFFFLATDLLHWAKKGEFAGVLRFSRGAMIVGAAVTILFIALDFSRPAEERTIALDIWAGFSWLMIINFATSVTINIMKFPKYSVNDAISDIFLLVATSLVLGTTFAYWVRDVGGPDYDVTLKGDKLENVRLVMITSHHTILYADERPIVVPTAEIIKLQKRPTARTKVECAAAEAC